MISTILVFITFLICVQSLRVFVIDEDNGPKVWSVQLADPDDSASEQVTKELFSSSTLSEVGQGIAYNFQNNKVFFQGRLSVIPDDISRTLKMSVKGKNLRSINSICDVDLNSIATSGNFTYTVGQNKTLFQGGLENNSEMIPILELPFEEPTFMKFYQNSLYISTGYEIYEIVFSNETKTGEYLPVTEPVVVFSSPDLMQQFDFDPTSGLMYYATGQQINSVNLTKTNPQPSTVVKGLKNPIGVAISKDPHYLLYTENDALYQYDFDNSDTSELETFTEVYGIAVSSGPTISSLSYLVSIFFSLILLTYFF